MKFSVSLLFVYLIFCCPPSKSQTALSAKTISETTQYTVSDHSGFSLKNNGTLSYSGPLNQLSSADLERLPKASLHVDEREISTPESLISSTINNSNRLNMISASIGKSTMSSDPSSKKIRLSYSNSIPSVISIKFRESSDTKELIDSQSLSIFPSGSFSF